MLEPDSFSCNAASTASSDGQRWVLALRLLQLGDLCNFQGNAVSWGTKARAQERASRWTNAMELLRAAKEAGVQMQTITCNTMLSSCQKEWPQCFDLLEVMRNLPCLKLNPSAEIQHQLSQELMREFLTSNDVWLRQHAAISRRGFVEHKCRRSGGVTSRVEDGLVGDQQLGARLGD